MAPAVEPIRPGGRGPQWVPRRPRWSARPFGGRQG